MELYPIERRHGASEQTVTSSEAPVEANDVEIQCVVPEANTGVSHNTDNGSSLVATATPAAGATVESIEIETSPASSMNFVRLPVALAALVLPSSSSSPSSSLVGDASTNNGSSARANVVAQEARPVEATSVTVATPAANVPGAASAAFAESVVCGDEEQQGESSMPGYFTASRRSLRASSRSSASSPNGGHIDRAVVISADGATQNPYYISDFEAEMFQSRSTVNCFAYMNILFTILDVFAADTSGGWFVLLILSLVGPACGMYGARHLWPKAAAVYLLSCVIDLVVLFVTFLGSYESVWVVILFIVQTFLTRVALSYYKALRTIGPERLQVLRDPNFLDRALAAQASIRTRLPRYQPGSGTSATERREAHHHLQREMGQR